MKYETFILRFFATKCTREILCDHRDEQIKINHVFVLVFGCEDFFCAWARCTNKLQNCVLKIMTFGVSFQWNASREYYSMVDDA